MTVTYGFYNSVGNDRQYDAVQMSKIFDGIISDGVYSTIGTSLMVTASGGLNVTVGVGRAWFNHTWTYNDAPLVLEVTQGNAVLPRVDTVVLEIDANDPVRANRIFVLPGTPNTNPSPAALTNDANKHQYPLAYIAVGVDAQAVLPVNITNKVGTTACPFVTGVITQVTTNALIAQWEAEFDGWFAARDAEFQAWYNEKTGDFATWYATQTGDFDTWFQSMKDQLSTDAAGNLQNEIDTHTHGSGNHGGLIPGSGIAPDAIDDTKVGDRVVQLIRRQGVASGPYVNDWSMGDFPEEGLANYAPGPVRMQVGCIYEKLIAGQYQNTFTVTFPIPFSQPPIVLLGWNSLDYPGDAELEYLFLYQTSATDFVMYIRRDMPEVGQAGERQYYINWLAIGPE